MNKYFVNISLEVDINKYDNIQAIVESFDLIGIHQTKTTN